MRRGGGWASGIHPDDQVHIKEGWYQAALTPAPYSAEFRFVRPDGQEVWVLCISSPVQNDNGEVESWVGSITDITELKKSEALLRQAKQQLEDRINEINTLRGIMPICMHCKNIRDDEGFWSKVEAYIMKNTEAEFSHGICPDCAAEHYPDMNLYEK